MTPILGIDLDTKRVTLAYRVGKAWHVESQQTNDTSGLINALLNAYGSGVEKAYIEQPWLRLNSNTYAKLCGVFGLLEGLCRYAGIESIGVNPRTWQSAMFAVHGKRDEMKRLSILRAAAEGAAPRNDHEADAVCIAVWAAVKERNAA